MLDWFKRSEHKLKQTHLTRVSDYVRPALLNFDPLSALFMKKVLPRGVLIPRLDPDRERHNYWMSPYRLLQHRYAPGQLIIGKLANTFLGHMDDRPIVTVAERAIGKTTTVLEPQFLLTSGRLTGVGSQVDLSRSAAKFRRRWDMMCGSGSFGSSGELTASFNPLVEL